MPPSGHADDPSLPLILYSLGAALLARFDGGDASDLDATLPGLDEAANSEGWNASTRTGRPSWAHACAAYLRARTVESVGHLEQQRRSRVDGLALGGDTVPRDDGHLGRLTVEYYFHDKARQDSVTAN